MQSHHQRSGGSREDKRILYRFRNSATRMNEAGCILEQIEYQFIFYKTQKTNIIFFTNVVKKKKTRR
jgi:hypothetical protein